MKPGAANMKTKSLIVELVGPPGSGKSSLANIVLQRDSSVQVSMAPYFRRIGHIPFFVTNLLSLLPTFLRLHRSQQNRWLTSRDIALMAILNGWHRTLERQRSGNPTIVLEEGAVCLLAKLHGFGSDLLRTENAKTWWDCVYKQWAETLDLVIQLETPIPTLLERVRARGVEYEIGELTDEQAIQYLTRIRVAQEHVLSILTAQGRGIQVLSVNTADKAPDRIYDAVVAFGLEHGQAWFSPDVPANAGAVLARQVAVQDQPAGIE